MLDVDLPREIEKRIAEIAGKTGVSKSEFVREAVLAQIDDLEDAYLARKALEEGGKRVPLEALKKKYGVE